MTTDKGFHINLLNQKNNTNPFRYGFFQKKFLSTSKVTGAAINLGNTRGRGSTTRIKQWNYNSMYSTNGLKFQVHYRHHNNNGVHLISN